MQQSAGSVLGEGMKGRVMEYGTKKIDPESFEHLELKDISEIKLYVMDNNKKDIGEVTKPASFIDELKNLDKKQQYIVKEFTLPSATVRTFGASSKEYMMRELKGFSNILPLIKKHNIIGMPYGKQTLFGFEIHMKSPGYIYDGSVSRCFVINAKCSQMMSESVVNAFSENEFSRFVVDILSMLVEIQKLDVAHGDIRLNNIMKCKNKYALIDWETNRLLDYGYLTSIKDYGLSPLYYKIAFGSAWYAAFKVALPVYYQVTGGYDTVLTSVYADNIVAYYTELFDKFSTEETLQKVKYSLDLCAFGMILYGILLRNPNINKTKHKHFIMNLFKAKDAATALKMFKENKNAKTSKRKRKRKSEQYSEKKQKTINR